MLTLNNLKSPKGANRNTKRIGRGQGSGWGTQAGKGHKGQKARSGGGVMLGFEGGQMPIYRRLPKRGFSNAPFKTEYAIVTLDQIASKFSEGEVSRESLVKAGLLNGKNKRLPIKILTKGEFNTALTFVNISKFSKSAQELVEKAGGKIETREEK
ncbi:MAG: 50S ribosomal protein L15 [Bacteriovoracaceae bacterium]|jgi:large subunit ribosomal protein L15|nr:50S ribosomal protein L15 [Halobacteriovoraceae bacterium]MDP7321737.1 50S ribosomal protein L15 [Bacteriovoracaceae bacterium]|tara:strand:- start:367 stop:831 length:465 start_codon:yes stop_codon:yes gene_type:complete